MTSDEIRTLDLEEIARRCATVSARRRALYQLIAASRAASIANPRASGLLLAVLNEFERRPLQFERAYVDDFVRAIDALCAFGDVIATAAQARIVSRALDAEETGK